MIPITTTQVTFNDIGHFFIPGDDSREAVISALEDRCHANHVSLLSSGRAALKVALENAARRGDRVCIPAYTCPLLFDVVLSVGMQPVPVDVDYDTIAFDGSLLEEAKKGSTTAIAVHLFGDPVSLRETRDAIGKEMVLIEDCAQSLGALTDSSPVGSQGDYSIFSFGIGKTITAGIGGAIASREPMVTELAAESLRDSVSALYNLLSMLIGSRPAVYSVAYPFLKSLRRRAEEEQAKRIASYTPSRFSSNSLPQRCCRVLATQIRELQEIVEQRRIRARMLTDLLTDSQLSFGLSRQALDGLSTFTRYVVRVRPSARLRIMKALNKGGFETEIPYASLARFLPTYGKFPVTKRLLEESLTLPVHGRMSEDDVQRMAMIVRRAK